MSLRKQSMSGNTVACAITSSFLFSEGKHRTASLTNEPLYRQTCRKAVKKQENCMNLTLCSLRESLSGRCEGPPPPEEDIPLAKAQAPGSHERGEEQRSSAPASEAASISSSTQGTDAARN